ncbi:carboxylic ester hydrolase [Paenarthrobacter histidinolovorans]|nr:carboxylic ester hydrolase [Paenarthrobacter histidinolovorans]
MLEQREDCLVLSITAPSDAENLPVMVWFHGGAYLSGGGEAPKYGADDLARNGVVVVSVTYRLGVFGYLPPGGEGVENLGLLDQIEALRWVAKNIAAFGGDPAQVTLFGQSAGGDSIIALMLAASARGLFHRAIVQSAPLGLRVKRASMVAEMRRVLSRHLPEPASSSTMDVLAAQGHVVSAAKRFGRIGGLPFAPTIEEGPLPADFYDALGSATDIDLLIGSNRADAAPFVAMSPISARLARLGWLGLALKGFLTLVLTRMVFANAVDRIAAIWTKAGGRVATYRFDWSPKNGELGACHCIELPFLFTGDWSDAPMLADNPIPEDLAQTMRDAWTGFARSGISALPGRSIRFGANQP